MLLVEQNAQMALSVADRAYVLETGQITMSGDAQALLHNDAVTVPVAATVSSSILFIVLFAKSVGALLPILAEKIGVDPAVMANPLISTVTDAVSLLIYIYVAKLILHI